MNGWTNRETWLVNVWFNPETKEDVDYIEETLEDEFMDIHGMHGIYIDLMNFGSIDWNELRQKNLFCFVFQMSNLTPNDEIWGNVRDTQNIPTNIKNKIIAHVETGLDGYKVVNVDVVDDMIEVAYFAYSMGWKDGFMDINQEPDEDIENYGGTK